MKRPNIDTLGDLFYKLEAEARAYEEYADFVPTPGARQPFYDLAEAVQTLADQLDEATSAFIEATAKKGKE